MTTDLLVGDSLWKTSRGRPRKVDSLVHQREGVAKCRGVEHNPGDGDPETNHHINQSILQLDLLP